MKKKIFGGIAVLAIAAVAAWNVSVNKQTEGFSTIMLANVQALAQESNPNVITCYNTARISPTTPGTPEPVWTITFCNGCSTATCYEYRDSGSCTVNSGFRYV